MRNKFKEKKYYLLTKENTTVLSQLLVTIEAFFKGYVEFIVKILNAN